MREQLAEEISIETLAELVELSPFHFLAFSSRQRECRRSSLSRASGSAARSNSSAKPRESDRSCPGGRLYSPSHFAKVFRRMTGVTQQSSVAPSEGLPGHFTANTRSVEQGEGGGGLRSIASPEACVEDFRAAILLSAPRLLVDRNRIGVIGIVAVSDLRSAPRLSNEGCRFRHEAAIEHSPPALARAPRPGHDV